LDRPRAEGAWSNPETLRWFRFGKPFFVWWNSTRMHVFTHLKKESEGKTGLGVYPDGMVEHDGHVGILLDKIDELGIADNTIVMYSTDNGAEVMTWPDGGSTPFRGEKDTNYEGGWRVPCAIRWPGVIKPGTISNDIFSHTDMLPTLLAAAGEPDIVEKLKKGHKAGNKTFKVHIDCYNLLPFLKGEAKQNPRRAFLYWSDEGDLMAIRFEQWKVHFMEQRARGLAVWQEPLVSLRFPKLFNLRSDPFERAEHVLRQVGRRPHVCLRTGAGGCRPIPQDFRGVPPPPEAVQLQY
jgi:arylsulfatase